MGVLTPVQKHAKMVKAPVSSIPKDIKSKVALVFFRKEIETKISDTLNLLQIQGGKSTKVTICSITSQFGHKVIQPGIKEVLLVNNRKF